MGTSSIKGQQPAIDTALLEAQARQEFQVIGMKTGSLPDLSFLNAPDPFLSPGIDIRRGSERHRVLVGVSDAQQQSAPSEISPASHISETAPTSAAQPTLPAVPLGEITQLLKMLLMKALASVQSVSAGRQFDLEEILKKVRGLAGALKGMLNSGSPKGDAYQAILHEPAPRTGQVSTEEMIRIVADHSAIMVDGRTQLEFAIGHIPGAISVAPKPGAPKSKHVSDVAEIAKIVPDRKAPIVVYCNGPFCGKSRRLGEELLKAGFTNVRRYQLGTPVWRALVGPMEIEPEGIRYVRRDQTAVFLDARLPEDFAAGSVPGARNVPVGEVVAAKSDGRLPMDDFNTRVVTFGENGSQALTLAEVLTHTGFSNLKFYGGTFADFLRAIH